MQATNATSAAAWAPVRGSEASRLSTAETGGLDASACPVTRIRHICMPNASSDHTPDGPPQWSTSDAGVESVSVNASANVNSVSSTASTKGSGAVARNTALIRRPSLPIMR